MATAENQGDNAGGGGLRGYLGEFRQHARPLAAASLGVGTSLPLFAYSNSIFAPHLIEQFGWSRGQFALIGLTMLTTLLILPFAGRFTDKFGVRAVALTGTLLLPLGFAGYALQSGSFGFYAFVFTAVLAIGSLTGPLVYSRLIAQHFVRSQGLALTVMNCVPALLAIPLAPMLNWCIELYGWRAAYAGLGVFVFVVSIVAVWLAGPYLKDGPVAVKEEQPGSARADYGIIFKAQVFWVIAIALYLCQLQTQLHSSQMNLMIIDQGVTKQTAANIAAVYAAGTLIGRIVCGVALDHFSTRIVTFISMGIPAIGFLLLGSSFDSLPVIAFSMLLVGVSVGAEADLMCFLVARYFKLRIYGTTIGVMYCFSFLASASGSILVKFSLDSTDSFTPALYFIAGTIVVGSLLFLLLPKDREFEKVG